MVQTIGQWSLKSHGEMPVHGNKRVGHVIYIMQYLCLSIHEHGLQFTGSANFGICSSCQLFRGCNFIKNFLY